jgi:hypothetical protein
VSDGGKDGTLFSGFKSRANASVPRRIWREKVLAEMRDLCRSRLELIVTIFARCSKEIALVRCDMRGPWTGNHLLPRMTSYDARGQTAKGSESV